MKLLRIAFGRTRPAWFFLLFSCVLPALPLAAEVPPADSLVRYVNPFIGTTDYGTTNPGAVCPNGMMSVSPFNVMGSERNRRDKDSTWWSTPYEHRNAFLTGFSHVNLSGVGCPDLGSLLLMPAAGPLTPDYREYGSTYADERAEPGYYAVRLTPSGIYCEVSATPRTAVARFTYPGGPAHVLMNLGQGLTNESGATFRFVGDREIEGSKLLGTFCYNPGAVFPVYFVMRVEREPSVSGSWKKMRPMGVEAQWDNTAGKYKLYPRYRREMSGDDIGAWFSFDAAPGEQVLVRTGVSFVSIEEARRNLETEQGETGFDEIRRRARDEWEDALSRIRVEGGTADQRTVFYTALYHTLIHPNLLSDASGTYPMMGSGETGRSDRPRYTVFSLWDTYRNLHQLLTLVYPRKQTDMVRSMLGMARESGWLPRWELYGRETYTMEGDPALAVIADTWVKGLRGFDVREAYAAMLRSATAPGTENPVRPDNSDYLERGYVPLREPFDNSVSHTLEYAAADYALSVLADSLDRPDDAARFRHQSRRYRAYYCADFGTLRPILPDGTFYPDFDPRQGENFEPSPGFHEGSAWNYTFAVPHDIDGLTELMGGKDGFVNKLQYVFDAGLYDPANEPDIVYPFLFSRYPDEAWRTQRTVRDLLEEHYRNAPDGIPGNDDAGTMSAWAVFAMMGFYPYCPGVPEYILTTPVFDRVEIRLDPEFHGTDRLILEKKGRGWKTRRIQVGDRVLDGFVVSHREMLEAGRIVFRTAGK